ncbi:tetratricopeptide repeat protein [Abditibacterium utsteinense]|nr:tetratricopeptide repeat protein [Abditibacterium utsteinense]
MRSFLGLSAFLVLLPFSNAFAQSAPQKMKAIGKEHSHAPEKPQSKGKTAKKESPADAFWRKSDDAFHAGNYPLAVGFHRKIVALDPHDIESYSVASWLLWSLGKPDDALQFIQQGIRANPKNPEMWDAAGQQFSLQKRALDAENAFGKAIQFSVKGRKGADMMLRRRYGHAAQGAGHLAKSIGIWRALVADFPNDAVNRNNLKRVEKAAQPNGGNTQTAALDVSGVVA